jgi:hypothetical protein
VNQVLPLEQLHKYGTGSCSDRVQASVQSTSNGQINWFIESTTVKSKLSISHRAPGRYSSRFRICAEFVELYCLTHTKPSHYVIGTDAV